MPGSSGSGSLGVGEGVMGGESSAAAPVDGGSSATSFSTRLREMPNLAYWALIGEKKRAAARAGSDERTIMITVLMSSSTFGGEKYL